MTSISSTDNFDFYTVNLPDGSTPSFANFSDFLAHCKYYAILYPIVLRPKLLSFSIFEVLGVCSFYPLIFCGE